jgi:hypothetical protein
MLHDMKTRAVTLPLGPDGCEVENAPSHRLVHARLVPHRGRRPVVPHRLVASGLLQRNAGTDKRAGAAQIPRFWPLARADVDQRGNAARSDKGMRIATEASSFTNCMQQFHFVRYRVPAALQKRDLPPEIVHQKHWAHCRCHLGPLQHTQDAAHATRVNKTRFAPSSD